MTNVFLSWSGDQSREIAEELRNWIPSVLQFAKPYFTPNDIEKGTKWVPEISKKLADSNVGIICLTKDNLHKPWILFEAGALSKDLEKSKVCSILFGMENTDLTGPLTTFQTTNFKKSDFKKLMFSINESSGSSALSRETFERVFEMWWPQIDEKITSILAKEVPPKEANLRNDRELLEEILLLTRSYSRHYRSDSRSQFRSVVLANFISALEEIMVENRSMSNRNINEACGELIKIAVYLMRLTEKPDREIESKIKAMIAEQSEFIPF